MKKITLSLSAILLSVGTTFAQTAVIDLDVNNVKARLMTAGDMFWDMPGEQAAYEFPKGSGKNSTFAAGLWIAGKDASTNQLKVAAQTYRQNGSDFWAGPLSSTGTISSVTSSKWDRFWKVNKADIDVFKNIAVHTVANTPPSILDWPAVGNPYAIDAFSNPLAITKNLAPFIDVNNDGVYDATQGDYPAIKGDQAIWWVFNDQRPHGETGSSPLNIEVKMMAFACSTNDALNNTTFYDYQIQSYSTTSLDSVRIGFWNDVDLGYGFDDYIGFDSSRRMGIAYNGDGLDDGANGYGSNLTQTGIIILKTPNDNATSKAPLGAFTFYDNSAPGDPNGNPENATHYMNYLNAKWKNGMPFTHSCNARDSNAAPTNYVYPDEPNDSLGWSEKACNRIPYDRRMILATNDFTLPANSSNLYYEVAIVNTPMGSNNNDFTTLKTMADFVIAHPDGCNESVLSASANELLNDINLYPNPANNKVNIKWSLNGVTQVSLENITGQTIESKTISNNKEISFNTSHLQTGVYFIQLKTSTVTITKKFTVE